MLHIESSTSVDMIRGHSKPPENAQALDVWARQARPAELAVSPRGVIPLPIWVCGSSHANTSGTALVSPMLTVSVGPVFPHPQLSATMRCHADTMSLHQEKGGPSCTRNDS
jgi:hypothetical protein